MCRLRDAKFLDQPMGLLPEARLKPAPAFNHVMLDLFGPYTVRGEVQKSTSGKAYGVMFTDLAMRAVHIEAVFGYNTGNFLLAVSRFASLRGWPEIIYSDPGSQLLGAERELKEAWQRIDRESLQRDSVKNGSTWVFGPSDSAWHQGAVESLIKVAKRAIHFSVSNQRLSVPEFLLFFAPSELNQAWIEPLMFSHPIVCYLGGLLHPTLWDGSRMKETSPRAITWFSLW